jgi:hypothetical protein
MYFRKAIFHGDLRNPGNMCIIYVQMYKTIYKFHLFGFLASRQYCPQCLFNDAGRLSKSGVQNILPRAEVVPTSKNRSQVTLCHVSLSCI